ncbi:hypothetical protein ANO14919_018180 [Xylariales sp. No.14919]|nr:hypothetical protein ANO14919_018180 [Xylariales sp. No.14919]
MSGCGRDNILLARNLAIVSRSKQRFRALPGLPGPRILRMVSLKER